MEQEAGPGSCAVVASTARTWKPAPAPVARMLNKVLGTDYPEREWRSEQDLGRGDSFSP